MASPSHSRARIRARTFSHDVLAADEMNPLVAAVRTNSCQLTLPLPYPATGEARNQLRFPTVQKDHCRHNVWNLVLNVPLLSRCQGTSAYWITCPYGLKKHETVNRSLTRNQLHKEIHISLFWFTMLQCYWHVTICGNSGNCNIIIVLSVWM